MAVPVSSDEDQVKSLISAEEIAGRVEELAAMVRHLRDEEDIFLSAVTYPAVEKGVLLLRIMPTSLHTTSDVERTLDALDAVLARPEFAACTDPAAAAVGS